MPDREKVIADIEEQITWIRDNDFHKFPAWGHAVLAMQDALALLKEQEAVEPRRIDGKRNHFIKCGNCNYDLLTGYMFCPRCGRKVKWNE